jgi:hypothetical protein
LSSAISQYNVATSFSFTFSSFGSKTFCMASPIYCLLYSYYSLLLSTYKYLFSVVFHLYLPYVCSKNYVSFFECFLYLLCYDAKMTWLGHGVPYLASVTQWPTIILPQRININSIKHTFNHKTRCTISWEQWSTNVLMDTYCNGPHCHNLWS